MKDQNNRGVNRTRTPNKVHKKKQDEGVRRSIGQVQPIHKAINEVKGPDDWLMSQWRTLNGVINEKIPSSSKVNRVKSRRSDTPQRYPFQQALQYQLPQCLHAVVFKNKRSSLSSYNECNISNNNVDKLIIDTLKARSKSTNANYSDQKVKGGIIKLESTNRDTHWKSCNMGSTTSTTPVPHGYNGTFAQGEVKKKKKNGVKGTDGNHALKTHRNRPKTVRQESLIYQSKTLKKMHALWPQQQKKGIIYKQTKFGAVVKPKVERHVTQDDLIVFTQTNEGCQWGDKSHRYNEIVQGQGYKDTMGFNSNQKEYVALFRHQAINQKRLDSPPIHLNIMPIIRIDDHNDQHFSGSKEGHTRRIQLAVESKLKDISKPSTIKNHQIKSIQIRAVIFIQRAWRAYRTRSMVRKYFGSKKKVNVMPASLGNNIGRVGAQKQQSIERITVVQNRIQKPKYLPASPPKDLDRTQGLRQPFIRQLSSSSEQVEIFDSIVGRDQLLGNNFLEENFVGGLNTSIRPWIIENSKAGLQLEVANHKNNSNNKTSKHIRPISPQHHHYRGESSNSSGNRHILQVSGKYNQANPKKLVKDAESLLDKQPNKLSNPFQLHRKQMLSRWDEVIGIVVGGGHQGANGQKQSKGYYQSMSRGIKQISRQKDYNLAQRKLLGTTITQLDSTVQSPQSVLQALIHKLEENKCLLERQMLLQPKKGEIKLENNQKLDNKSQQKQSGRKQIVESNRMGDKRQQNGYKEQLLSPPCKPFVRSIDQLKQTNSAEIPFMEISSQLLLSVEDKVDKGRLPVDRIQGSLQLSKTITKNMNFIELESSEQLISLSPKSATESIFNTPLPLLQSPSDCLASQFMSPQSDQIVEVRYGTDSNCYQNVPREESYEDSPQQEAVKGIVSEGVLSVDNAKEGSRKNKSHIDKLTDKAMDIMNGNIVTIDTANQSQVKAAVGYGYSYVVEDSQDNDNESQISQIDSILFNRSDLSPASVSLLNYLVECALLEQVCRDFIATPTLLTAFIPSLFPLYRFQALPDHLVSSFLLAGVPRFYPQKYSLQQRANRPISPNASEILKLIRDADFQVSQYELVVGQQVFREWRKQMQTDWWMGWQNQMDVGQQLIPISTVKSKELHHPFDLTHQDSFNRIRNDVAVWAHSLQVHPKVFDMLPQVVKKHQLFPTLVHRYRRHSLFHRDTTTILLKAYFNALNQNTIEQKTRQSYMASTNRICQGELRHSLKQYRHSYKGQQAYQLIERAATKLQSSIRKQMRVPLLQSVQKSINQSKMPQNRHPNNPSQSIQSYLTLQHYHHQLNLVCYGQLIEEQPRWLNCMDEMLEVWIDLTQTVWYELIAQEVCMLRELTK